MQIKTKFDKDQVVWLIDPIKKQEIISAIVDEISVFLDRNGELEIYYELFRYGDFGWYDEKWLFATKEEAEQKLKEIENAKN